MPSSPNYLSLDREIGLSTETIDAGGITTFYWT